MPLKQQLTYVPIVREIVGSKDILRMLKDVRNSIINIEPDFEKRTLKETLEIAESGNYLVEGQMLIELDLSLAKNQIKFYRENSEWGCRSCLNLVADCSIDVKDFWFWYCKKHEDSDKVIEELNSDGGFSPLIEEYYENGCDDNNLRFSRTLSQLFID